MKPYFHRLILLMFFLPAIFPSALRAGEKELPFRVPDKLPNGEFLFFQSAESVSSFPYSDGTVINVYTYADAKAARMDFAALDNAGAVSKIEGSTELQDANARIFTAGKKRYLAFRMDDSVLAIVYEEKSLTSVQAMEIGEWICKTAGEKMRKLFATPEATFKTLCLAIKDGNQPLVFASFAAPLPRNFRSRVGGKMGSTVMPTARQAPHFVISETEKLDNETVNCNIVEDGTSRWNSPWFQVLREGLPGAGLNLYQNSEDFWIPFRRQGGLWKIDLELLMKKSLAHTEDDFKAVKDLEDCRRNFYQIASALRNWVRINQRLPKDPGDIIAIRRGAVKLTCPGAETQGMPHDEHKSNLMYFPYPMDWDEISSAAIIFCDREGAHPKPSPKRVVLTKDFRVIVYDEENVAEMIAEAERLCKEAESKASDWEIDKPLTPLTQEEEKALRALVEQLGSESWNVREKAQEALVGFGPRAILIVSEAKDSQDDEIKWRVGRILKAYREQMERK